MYTRIRDLRKQQGWSQYEMAQKLGLPDGQKTISRYERGDIRIPVPVLVQMSDLFNVSIDYLLGQTDVRTKPPRSEAYTDE